MMKWRIGKEDQLLSDIKQLKEFIGNLNKRDCKEGLKFGERHVLTLAEKELEEKNKQLNGLRKNS